MIWDGRALEAAIGIILLVTGGVGFVVGQPVTGSVLVLLGTALIGLSFWNHDAR